MALVLLITTLGSILVTVIGFLALLEKLPPNGWAGIRTPYTMRSPENWYRTHRAGAPLMIFTGIAASMAGLAFLPFAIAGEVGPTLAGIVAIVQAGLLFTGAIGSLLVGTAAAKRHATTDNG
ncbi:MAG: SdpI family protein [Dehalococcoidia bacterium]|nr:SdpI family protein [Dehalococcoidia bacterium]